MNHSQTESISRRLKANVWIISVFFLLGLLGIYFSSQTMLNSLAKFYRMNQVYDYTRQINHLVQTLSEAINRSESQNLSTVFRVTSEQLDVLFEQAISLSSSDTEHGPKFVKLKESVEHIYAPVNRIIENPNNLTTDRIIAKQLELETIELLNKIQISLSNESDSLFASIYDQRFRPLTAGLILTLVFIGCSLYLGMSTTNRVQRSIKNLLTATEQVTNGDLTVRAEVLYNDEIGALTHSFNEMVDYIRTTTVSKDELMVANKELEAFSYSVSHDLRAPLRAVDGFSLALIEDLGPKLDGESKGYLERIRAGVQRMGKLIDDMLNLSRLTRKSMSFREVDMSDLMKEIFTELESNEPNRNTEIKIADNLKVIADPDLIKILLENLATNAWKYTSKNEFAKIEFGIEQVDGETTYYIKDNGAGFDMQYYDKLFGAFQRLHKNEEFPGTGVGLATVYRIVRRHGGTIWAKSEVGKGAIFYFSFNTNIS